MGRVGVLLLNLGGPEQLKDVRPFLFNLFSDPDIVRLPFPWLQKPLAWLISVLRTNKSQNNYRQIGGGSPLRKITEAQGKALAKKFAECGQKIDVHIGMRYWYPFTEEAINDIKHDCPDKLVILPLYPQFSISTSGSSFRILEKIWQTDPVLRQIEYTLIPSWYDNPNYLKAMADLIIKELNKCSNPEQVHIFFSAHGVPQSYVEEAGDPYQAEIEACTHLLMSTINRSNAYTLAYQSKVGPVEWLKPYAEDALQALGKQGIKDLLVVPISFVSEHIETLQEIDIEYREAAEKAGIYNFSRVPALNTHPIFIDALAELVIHSLEKPPVTFKCITHPRENIVIYPKKSWQWGITNTAEIWNGRLAMLGFIGLLVELISGHGILHYLKIL